jgi:hypothetical protein
MVKAAHSSGVSSDPRSAWFVVVPLMLSLVPVVFGMTWGITETHAVTLFQIAPAGGSCFTATIQASTDDGWFRVAGDDPRHPRRSRTRLYEDGRRLGPPHRPHDFIRGEGGGQFSHWGSSLYFSTSDNTDPRTNGRPYSIVTSATLPPEVAWIWAICVVLPAGLALWLGPPHAVTAWRRGRGWSLAAAALVTNVPAIVSMLGGSTGTRLHLPGPPAAIWTASTVLSLIIASIGGVGIATIGPGLVRSLQSRWAGFGAGASQLFGRRDRLGLLARAATLLIPAAAFAIVLRSPLPPRLLIASYSSVTDVALLAGIVLWACHVRRDWIGTVVALTLTLTLFALPLAALWQHLTLQVSAIGGLLPYSDANGYYHDARGLIQGTLFGWSARRPLFAGLFATLLALTGENLQLTVALLVALNGVAVLLLAREIGRSHGPAAAAIATLVLFFFYRSVGCGTTLTENLGFAMGNVAFAVLWRAFRETDRWGVGVGLGLLTLALMARAGAFFVLPAIALAALWVFRANRQWLRVGAIAIGAVTGAAGVTLVVGRLLADPSGAQTAFSNFSYSLYGLVVGGKGWGQVVSDHPQAREGAEMYLLAWNAFLARPMGLVEGAVKMWSMYLDPRGLYHAFTFVADDNLPWLWPSVCFAASAAAMLLACRRSRQPLHALLLSATAGHLASIPFVPPIDGGPRIYAATVPVLGILVGVGSAVVLRGLQGVLAGGRWLAGRRGRHITRDQHITNARSPRTADWFGMTLTATVLLGPLVVASGGRAPVLAEAACPSGTLPVYVRFARGSFLHIVGNVPDVDDTRIAAPLIRERDLRVSLTDVIDFRNDQDRLIAGKTILNGYDLKTGRYLWLVTPTDLLPEPPALLHVCGRDALNPASPAHHVFYAETVRRDPRS